MMTSVCVGTKYKCSEPLIFSSQIARLYLLLFLQYKKNASLNISSFKVKDE